MNQFKIVRIRLHRSAPVGRGAEVTDHIGIDTSVSSQLPTLAFDADERFVRVNLPGHIELIPISNIASIHVEYVQKENSAQKVSR